MRGISSSKALHYQVDAQRRELAVKNFRIKNADR